MAFGKENSITIVKSNHFGETPRDPVIGGELTGLTSFRTDGKLIGSDARFEAYLNPPETLRQQLRGTNRFSYLEILP